MQQVVAGLYQEHPVHSGENDESNGCIHLLQFFDKDFDPIPTIQAILNMR